jgi:hypothetical protein
VHPINIPYFAGKPYKISSITQGNQIDFPEKAEKWTNLGF